jgi:hypothetical protein
VALGPEVFPVVDHGNGCGDLGIELPLLLEVFLETPGLAARSPSA